MWTWAERWKCASLLSWVEARAQQLYSQQSGPNPNLNPSRLEVGERYTQKENERARERCLRTQRDKREIIKFPQVTREATVRATAACCTICYVLVRSLLTCWHSYSSVHGFEKHTESKNKKEWHTKPLSVCWLLFNTRYLLA